MRVFIILIALSTLIGCGQESNLTDTELQLVNQLNLNPDLVSKIKSTTKSDLKQLPAIDQETGEMLRNQLFDGLYSEMNEERAIAFVRRNKAEFRKKEHLIFVIQGADSDAAIAIIKGNEELDILRYRRTDGINYGLDSEDVLKKVSEWDALFTVSVIGCERDWLHLEFEKLPNDLTAFANEVYEFCPDSVDQGVGSIEELEKAIISMRGVWLWWD